VAGVVGGFEVAARDPQAVVEREGMKLGRHRLLPAGVVVGQGVCDHLLPVDRRGRFEGVVGEEVSGRQRCCRSAQTRVR
jgi:hypothetical protein